MTKLKLRSFLKKYIHPSATIKIYLVTGENFWLDKYLIADPPAACFIDEYIDKKYYNYEVDFISDAETAGDYYDPRTVCIFIKEPKNDT